jgi:ATP-binding cassette subfamily G (WHITE) protein 2
MGDSYEISQAGARQSPAILESLRSFPPVGTAASPSPAYQARLSLLNSAVVFPPTPARATLYEITVHNLTYKVVSKYSREKKEKILLNNVSARANHSEVLAIAGPSGSSKTTFLDALAGQIKRSSLKGQILVNGKPMDSNFRRVSGYVTQDDAMYPTLTARETLMFSARLRLPGAMTIEEKRNRVESLIEMLGLKDCADTYVGDEKVRGVSGGERRRVSIGVDLVHDPAVLLLDEPTSGLDSTSALHVMQILSNMAVKRNRTVLLTIHQPSYRILDTINKFLVLSRGNVIYYGDVPEMEKYFNDLGYSMPENMSVVEHALDIIEEAQDQPEGIAHLVESQVKYQQNKDAMRLVAIGSPLIGQQCDDMSKPSFATSMMSEMWVLAHRCLLTTCRSKLLFVTRISLQIVAALIIGSLFYNSGHDYKGILQRTGYFNFALVTIIFSSNEALPIFLNERHIYIRESSRGAYRTLPFVISQALVMLPFQFLLASIFSSISYFMVGLVPTATAFFTFIGIVFLTLCVSNSLVAFVASVVPDENGGQTVILCICAMYYLLSGFFVQRTGIPWYWIWLHYLSSFKYPYELMLANEYGHLRKVWWFFGVDSQRVLEYFDAGKVADHLWINYVAMVSFMIGYRVLFYLSLRFNTKNVRQ